MGNRKSKKINEENENGLHADDYTYYDPKVNGGGRKKMKSSSNKKTWGIKVNRQ